MPRSWARRSTGSPRSDLISSAWPADAACAMPRQSRAREVHGQDREARAARQRIVQAVAAALEARHAPTSQRASDAAAAARMRAARRSKRLRGVPKTPHARAASIRAPSAAVCLAALAARRPWPLARRGRVLLLGFQRRGRRSGAARGGRARASRRLACGRAAFVDRGSTSSASDMRRGVRRAPRRLRRLGHDLRDGRRRRTSPRARARRHQGARASCARWGQIGAETGGEPLPARRARRSSGRGRRASLHRAPTKNFSSGDAVGRRLGAHQAEALMLGSRLP